jgi:hypothetical protein
MNTLAILAVTALVAILLAALLLRPTQTQTITITITSAPLSEEEERKKRALAYAQRHGNFHAHWGGAAGRPPY